MPFKHDPEVRALIAQLDEAKQRTRAADLATRAAEKPVREARRKLARSVERAGAAVKRAQSRAVAIVEEAAGGSGCKAFRERSYSESISLHAWELKKAEQVIAEALKTFAGHVATLQLFDLAHSVEADYPAPPAALDYAAVFNDATAANVRRHDAFRASLQRHDYHTENFP